MGRITQTAVSVSPKASICHHVVVCQRTWHGQLAHLCGQQSTESYATILEQDKLPYGHCVLQGHLCILPQDNIKPHST